MKFLGRASDGKSRTARLPKYGYHIIQDEIRECKERPERCPIDPFYHKESLERAQDHLRAVLYDRKVKAQISDFEEIARNYHHPQRYHAIFSSDPDQQSVRKFGEVMEQYVAQRGAIPSYIMSSLRFTLNDYLPATLLRVEIESKPVIDKEYGDITREWTAAAMTHKYRGVGFRADANTVFKTIKLDFTDYDSAKKSLDNLEALFIEVCERSGKWSRSGGENLDYSDHVKRWMDTSIDVVNAIEGTTRMEEFWQELQGDFGKTGTENTIIVDVDYRRSTFSGQVFKDFMRANLYIRGCTVDTDIRVRHTLNDGSSYFPSWTLSRKDNAWRFASTCQDERVLDIEVYTAEEIRSHIYWHMMNEKMTTDQNEALKVAQYGVDLYTTVESELARHNG